MSINSIDFEYVRRLVREHSAVALDAGKEYLADLYLKPLAEREGFASLAKLIEYLQSTPFGSLHIQVIESLLIYETTFFRDSHPFEALKTFILPEIINRKFSEKSLETSVKEISKETINIWSAACSSGQEAYTIAMLIKDHFPILLDKFNLQILASDFSSKALTRARQGIYNHWEIRRGLPKILQKKYFYENGNEWQIHSKIRSMIDFRQINLIDAWAELPKMDVIFLRNVLIYFDTETKKNILTKVKRQLKPNGYLFLGGGETTINLDDNFERFQLGKSICYRVP